MIELNKGDTMTKLEDFDPKSKKYPYPNKTDMHYLKFKKLKEFPLDKNYPYINKNKWFLFQDKLLRLLLVTIGFLIIKVRLGIKVIGKENIKKNKKLLKNGVISVSNHIHMMDYMAVNYGIKPFNPRVLVWDKNVYGDSRWFVRHIGGIPIPNDIQASKAFYKTIKSFLTDGGWLHLYAEGSMWELYRYIRPFKSGVSQIAYMTKKPILPMAFSYRRPGFIRKKIFKQEALITLNIGSPIMPDFNNTSFSKEDLTKKCHEEVVRLAGIKNNIYPPIFNDSRKIDY